MAAKISDAKPVVVFNADRLGSADDSQRLKRLIPAWIISGIVHVVLLFGFLFINVSGAESAPDTETAVFETQVDDNTQPPNLENDEIGLDPSVQTNYNVDRIEDVSVPGPVNAQEQVGIHNAPDGPPMTLPPPPGVGGNVGTGGGVDDPNRAGVGNMIGIAGGLGGPKMIAGGFGGRSGATRVKMLQEGGGNSESEAAVARGLKWLSEHQAPDGHWSTTHFNQHGKCNCGGAGSVDNDIAGTAFGLLPFLAAGQSHKTGADKGNLHTKIVDRALKFLVLKQNREGELHSNMYAQGLATIAVCEAYGLSSDPALRGPAQRAINYIVDAQSGEGGWRYTRRAAGYDTSICGWQLMALKSGQMAGLDVPVRTLKACTKWLDDAGVPDGGGYGYCSRGEGQATSAVGLLCRQYLGWGPRNPGLLAGVDRLQKWGPQPANMYYSYYATQVMHHMGGAAWDNWNPKMRDSLIAAQDKGNGANAHQKGSWFNAADAISSGHGGRMMQTSLSLVTLEVYYRHLPLYRRDIGADKAIMENK